MPDPAEAMSGKNATPPPTAPEATNTFDVSHVDRQDSNMTEHEPDSLEPTSLRVDWPRLVGARLEELVWGLLAEMGAADMIWRAGTADGVNAADGGRDIEATLHFPRDTGGVTTERWWIEAKGRAGTVSKRLVSDAVVNAAAYGEVNVVVVATNSVFTNAAHDWVLAWNKSGNRPRAVLWDRENLSIMVRDAPTVAARTLPEALSPSDRLQLLIERFRRFGETPTDLDLAFFWERPDAIRSADTPVAAVSLMLYAEPDRMWGARPWIALLNEIDPGLVLAEALSWTPWTVLHSKGRPLSMERQIVVAAHLLASCVTGVEPQRAAAIAANVWATWEDIDDWAVREARDHRWRDQIVLAIAEQVQLQMATICGHDCARVMTEATAFPPEMNSELYFSRFESLPLTTERILTITDSRVPCIAGSSLTDSGECLVTRQLSGDSVASETFFADLAAVMKFRRTNRSSQFLASRSLRRLT